MSNEIQRRILDLYSAGFSAREAMLKVSTGRALSTVGRWIRESGISRPRGGSKLRHSADMKARAIEMYVAGCSRAEIAKHFLIKPATVGKWMRDLSITRRRGAVCGKKNPAWKGGITPTHLRIRNCADTDRWRMRVFQRDGFRCSVCGIKGGDLEAHHILEFAKYPLYRFTDDNGQTMCRHCHRKYHGRQRITA